MPFLPSISTSHLPSIEAPCSPYETLASFVQRPRFFAHSLESPIADTSALEETSLPLHLPVSGTATTSRLESLYELAYTQNGNLKTAREYMPVIACTPHDVADYKEREEALDFMFSNDLMKLQGEIDLLESCIIAGNEHHGEVVER